MIFFFCYRVLLYTIMRSLACLSYCMCTLEDVRTCLRLIPLYLLVFVNGYWNNVEAAAFMVYFICLECNGCSAVLFFLQWNSDFKYVSEKKMNSRRSRIFGFNLHLKTVASTQFSASRQSVIIGSAQRLSCSLLPRLTTSKLWRPHFLFLASSDDVFSVFASAVMPILRTWLVGL